MENILVTSLIISFVVCFIIILFLSIKIIKQTEVGLVSKRFSFKKLPDDNPIALRGEAGYQLELLKPGLRFKFFLLYSVSKYPWVQIPAGEIGVVVAQCGNPLPTGAKSAEYKDIFGNFSDVKKFLDKGGQIGVQRPVLPPGTVVPMHPVAFLVITSREVFGIPISQDLGRFTKSSKETISPESFGLKPEQLKVTRIESIPKKDMIGIVTTFEGDPLPPTDIASRLGGFSDIDEMENQQNATDYDLIETILSSKNSVHNNYQDFQKFLDNGGKIGLQHDPLLYGAYTLNPFLMSVELVLMLIVHQGEVAVIKSYVGLSAQDTSGKDFKFGSLVRPGHRGIWQESLRTGKYPLNPHCYQAHIVPTSILTLNWSDLVSDAHNLDNQLKPIIAKSKEGFKFSIELQVQIHVADSRAPTVLSMVGTMQNLVSEILQAAVGNHFREKLQSMPAIKFIETRQEVQIEACRHIRNQLEDYKVETPGVYIQDVTLPEELVQVLTDREIAFQQIETYSKQMQAQQKRVEMEKAKGTADMQKELAKSQVYVSIKTNNSSARKAEADGEAEYIEKTGTAQGAKVKSIGLAQASAYKAQVEALGEIPTTLVNVVSALTSGKNRFVPEVFVNGTNGSNSIDGLCAIVTKYFLNKTNRENSNEAENNR